MMDIMEGDNGIDSVRTTFEKAITAAGLHVTEVGYMRVQSFLDRLIGFTYGLSFQCPQIWETIF